MQPSPLLGYHFLSIPLVWGEENRMGETAQLGDSLCKGGFFPIGFWL